MKIFIVIIYSGHMAQPCHEVLTCSQFEVLRELCGWSFFKVSVCCYKVSKVSGEAIESLILLVTKIQSSCCGNFLTNIITE